MQYLSEINKVGTPCFFVIFFCFKMLKNSSHKKSALLVFLNADRLLFVVYSFPSTLISSLNCKPFPSFGAAKVITLFIIPKI